MTDPLEPVTGGEGGLHALSFVERKNIHPVLFAFLCLAVVFILYQIVGGVVAFLITGGNAVTPENVNLIRMFTLLGQVILIFVPTLVLARLLSRNQSEIFPIRPPSWRESVSAVPVLSTWTAVSFFRPPTWAGKAFHSRRRWRGSSSALR